LYETTEKLLVLADAGIELIVRGLDGPRLLKATLRKRTWKESDRRVHGQDSLKVIAY
jgi:hypothetical protein